MFLHTGRLNINTYTYKNKKLKNRKLKRKRKQKRKRGSLREGREAPPRRCPHPFRFCFRFRFNFRFFNFLVLHVHVLIFNCPVHLPESKDTSLCIMAFGISFFRAASRGRSQRRKQHRERQVRAPSGKFAHLTQVRTPDA